jgi:GTP-binding protein Era
MQKSGFVAIIGRPNAGKSTLLNRLLGTSLSIVTPKAQTTRERVLGILTTPEQGQIVFMDTPGIHRAKEGGINAYMMQEARVALDGPSVIWYLVDPTSALKHETVVLELLAKIKSPVIILMNKSDLKRDVSLFKEDLRLFAQENEVALKEIIEISALEGIGVDRLLSQTWEMIPEGPFYYPDTEQLSDRPMRFFVAEKVREQLLLQLGDELPYCCAVEIESFEENTKPIRIDATIHVERESQKGMVIGKGGAKIKTIGQAARGEIESLVGSQIFLGLKVKLLKDWSKDARSLKRLGYVISERGRK